MKDTSEWLKEWNKLHQEYTKKGSEFRNNKMADYCEEMILKAKPAYYEGEPIMEDSWFDRLETSLRSLRPDSKVLEKVGS